MSYEAVDVFVSDTTALHEPIEGVVVKALNQSGTLTYGFQTTDIDGKASFLLEAPLTYQLRFYKERVNIKNPVFIEVVEAPSTPAVNQFDVSGEVFVLPVSTNPRLCVASGIFKRLDGSAAANVDMHFISKFSPILLEEDAVLTERISIRTDKNGYAAVTLIRFGKYNVTVEGFEDMQRCITVADLPNVNLPDLLFPRVEEISFSPPGPYTLSVGDELIVTPTILSSDGRELEMIDGDVRWASTDSNIVAVLPAVTTITLRALSSGVAQMTAERNDTSIIRIPNTPILGQPVDITIL